MDVKIESQKMVTPSVPTPKTKIKLSFLDHTQLPAYIGLTFYYKENGLDLHARLVKLEKSLSETLVLFYPFSGRYLEEGSYSFIDCGDQGVEFVVAKVDSDIDVLLDNEADPSMLANLSSFPTGLEEGISLIVIQVNVFKCGGLSIEARFNHKIADMWTISMFMSAWSMACRDGIKQVIPLSFDLGSLIPQKETGESDVEATDICLSPSMIIFKKLAFKIFTFRNDAISKLKAKITENLQELNPESTSLEASRVEVVSAVISKAIIEIKSAKDGANSKPFVISHAMNLRDKTNLNIAENSCGNFVTSVITPPRVFEQTGTTTLSILEMICDTIRKAKLEFSTAAEVDLRSLLEEKCKQLSDAFRKPMEGELNSIAFSSWNKFQFHEVNFGWGKPDIVRNPPAPLECIVLFDSKLNDGIEARVTLDEDDMLLLKLKLDSILQV